MSSNTSPDFARQTWVTCKFPDSVQTHPPSKRDCANSVSLCDIQKPLDSRASRNGDGFTYVDDTDWIKIKVAVKTNKAKKFVMT